MKTYGMIHCVDMQYRLIGIARHKSVQYFYFQASLFHLVKRYLFKGIFIYFSYDAVNTITKNNRSAYLITDVDNIFSTPRYFKESYYNKRYIESTLKDFLNSIDNALFVDFEMTMPNYNSKGIPFKAEIIQAGFVLVNPAYETVYTKNIYIQPVINPELNSRTIKFLGYNKTDFYADAVPYQDFYNEFKRILDEYNPTILVYGKNDILYLAKSFEVNNVPSLQDRMRIINLNKVIRNYYNLKNDPGLFKLYEIYAGTDSIQVHDALDDASVTMEIFKYFKADVLAGGIMTKAIKSILEPVIKVKRETYS